MEDIITAGSNKIADIQERLQSFQVIVSDIEGTTTSIPFVRSVLRSHCIEKLDKYITDQWDNAPMLDIRCEMKQGRSAPPSKDKTDSPIKSEKDLAREYILKNIQSKQTSNALKYLLTKIWEEGYMCGDLKGHLFPDVTPAFRKWIKEGLRVYMYSSGSKLAQNLLFTYSSEGDVHELISGFFDLDVGSKMEAESYRKIMEKVGCPAASAIFLTDNVKEAVAARKAGLFAVLVIREANEAIDSKYYNLFPIIHSFEEIVSLYDKRKLPLCDNVTSAKKAKLNEDLTTEDNCE